MTRQIIELGRIIKKDYQAELRRLKGND